MVIDEIEKLTSRKNHYNNIPKHIRIEVGRYALDHNIKGALEKISKQYSKFTFKDILISLWKTLLKKCEDNQTFYRKGRINHLSEILLKKTKGVIVGSRLAGTVISRRMVIAIETAVVKANDPGQAFASWSILWTFCCIRYTTTHSLLFQSEKILLYTINKVRLLTTFIVKH